MEAEKFYLGETIKLVAVIDNSPISVSLAVIDPGGVTKITAAAMTEEASGVWIYYYTSNIADLDGDYIFRITATGAIGSSIEEMKITIYEQS